MLCLFLSFFLSKDIGCFKALLAVKFGVNWQTYYIYPSERIYFLSILPVLWDEVNGSQFLRLFTGSRCWVKVSTPRNIADLRIFLCRKDSVIYKGCLTHQKWKEHSRYSSRPHEMRWLDWDRTWSQTLFTQILLPWPVRGNYKPWMNYKK